MNIYPSIEGEDSQLLWQYNGFRETKGRTGESGETLRHFVPSDILRPAQAALRNGVQAHLVQAEGE